MKTRFMSIFCLLVFLFTFTTATLGAENGTEPANAGYIELTGINYGEGTSGFIYHDDWLFEDSTRMSGDLAKASVVLAAAAYHPDLVSQIMVNMGFTILDQYDYGYSGGDRLWSGAGS